MIQIQLIKTIYHNLKEVIMEYKNVTETIISCAYRVYNKMGFGFLESVYEKCLPPNESIGGRPGCRVTKTYHSLL